MTETMAPP